MKDEHRDEAIKALYGLIDSLKNAQEIKVFDVENKNILNTFRYELKPTGWREISMNIVFKPKTNIDIEKIKKAIKFSCGYVTYNPDETCVVLPQSLNYNDGITLNREEYELYQKSINLSTEEKLSRLEEYIMERGGYAT